MTTVTQTGLTVEEAIEKALQQLNVSRKDVEVNVLIEGRKGFFGIGARDAVVKVAVKKVPAPIEAEKPAPLAKVTETSLERVEESDRGTAPEQQAVESDSAIDEEADPIEEAIDYLTNVAQEMKINDLVVTSETDGKYLYFQLESAKAALLIGKRGQTLNALQQLTQLVANQHATRFKVVRLNVGDYRERRKESLSRLADRMADKAVHTNRKVQLEPMPAYERKVIHHALSNRLDIETYSEGKDPHRYLVIEPLA